MRAAVLEGGRFVTRELPDPTPGPGQLLLRVAACGVCGSDVKSAGHMADGTVMGHELAGVVEAVGSGGNGDWQRGMPAVAMPVLGCGACPDCAAGDPARCQAAALLGVGGGPGAFAELVVVAARESFGFGDGDGVPLETGALVEPLAVGLHAVARGRLEPGDRVLVVGAGPVGLAVALWAARLGAREVVVSDPSAPRREAAGAFGATAVVDPAAEELGTGFDLVVECVGRPGMLDACLAAVRPRGRVVIAGVCLDADPFWPVVGLVKEVDVAFASYYTHREFGLAAQLLTSGRLDPGPFVTDRIGLDGLQSCVEELAGPTAQRKVLVVP